MREVETMTKRPPKGWTAAEVRICVRGIEGSTRMKPVAGFLSDDAPGLAITCQFPGHFGVTHLRSGALITCFDVRRRATRFAQEITPLANWTWSARALKRAKIGEAVRAIAERLR